MASWIITPFLPPPPTSEIRFHHPDYYTVLKTIQRNVDSQSRGYVGLIERQSSVGKYPVQDLQYSNGRRMSLPLMSSPPPPIHSSGSSQRVHLPHSIQPPQPPPTCIVEGSIDHVNYTKNQCSTETVPYTYDKKDTQKDESYASHQLSNENQRISTTSSRAVGEHYIQKSTITTTSTARERSYHKLKQSKLVTTPNGSIQLVNSHRAEDNTKNEENLQDHLDDGKKAQEKHTYVWSNVKSMKKEELDSVEKLFLSADECAVTLVFSDQSTQLHERKAKSTKHPIEIDGVCVAVPTTPGAEERPGLQFYFLPLDPCNHSLDSWCKAQLLGLLGHAKVICYDGQEIVTTLINHFGLHSRAGIWLEWHLLDVKVGAWLLDPDNVPNDFHQIISRFNIQLHPVTFHQACFEECICQDLSLMGPLMVKIYQHLLEHNLWPLFSEMETKLIPILGSMEAIGIQVNTEKLLHFDELLKLKIAQVESSAHKVAKRTFSINSTLQLRQVLFDELQLDKKCSRKLSKTQVLKQKSTSEAVLVQLQDLHPLPGLVLEYRQLCKMKATYITGLLPYISQGVLHPCWEHTGAATGRLVSCNPNIQAFPRQAINLGAVKKSFVVGKEEEHHTVEVREAVVSREGYTFLATDFRSIELRLLAHLSGDPALISILTTQSQNSMTCDVFTHLAAQWLNVSAEKVTTGDRERAKRVVYAIVYGVGKDKLAEMLSMNSNAAKELMTSFLGRFSEVQTFIQKAVTETRIKGYAQTICQRKRWFPHINSGNTHLKSYSERQAVNFPIQGSAADICKCGMVQIVQILAHESPQTRLLLQIHDELLFEVPDQDIELVSEKVKVMLESTDLIPSCRLKVPLEIRVTVGKNWAALTSQKL